MRLTDSLSDQDSAVVRKTTATPTGRRTSTFEIMSANPIVMPLQVAMNLLALRMRMACNAALQLCRLQN